MGKRVGVSACRRVGVSACRRSGACASDVSTRRYTLSPMPQILNESAALSRAFCMKDTPIRPNADHADTSPLRARRELPHRRSTDRGEPEQIDTDHFRGHYRDRRCHSYGHRDPWHRHRV